MASKILKCALSTTFFVTVWLTTLYALELPYPWVDEGDSLGINANFQFIESRMKEFPAGEVLKSALWTTQANPGDPIQPVHSGTHVGPHGTTSNLGGTGTDRWQDAFVHRNLTDGTNEITVAAIVAHGAAANPHSGHVDTTGDETIAGEKTFSTFPISPSAEPDADYEFANKKYVDDNAVPGGHVPSAGIRFYDDFDGQLVDETVWKKTVTGGGTSTLAPILLNGAVRIYAAGGSSILNWSTANTRGIFNKSQNIVWEARVKVDDITKDAYLIGFVQKDNGSNDWAMFRLYPETSGDDHWYCFNKISAGNTTTDSGVSATTTDWFLLRMEFSATSCKFYINDILKATHQANLTTLNLEPILQAAGGDNKELRVDYVEITQDR